MLSYFHKVSSAQVLGFYGSILILVLLPLNVVNQKQSLTQHLNELTTTSYNAMS